MAGRENFIALEQGVYYNTLALYERKFNNGADVADISDDCFRKTNHLNNVFKRNIEGNDPTKDIKGLKVVDYTEKMDRLNQALMAATVDAVAARGGLFVDREDKMRIIGLGFIEVKKKRTLWEKIFGIRNNK